MYHMHVHASIDAQLEEQYDLPVGAQREKGLAPKSPKHGEHSQFVASRRTRAVRRLRSP